MRERGDGSVTLGSQCPVAVGSFLDFAYSGEALITESNVDMLFQLASFLQVEIIGTHETSLHSSSFTSPACLQEKILCMNWLRPHVKGGSTEVSK